MARLFTAIELAAGTRAAIVSRQAEIAAALHHAGDRDLRITDATQLHLTLVFIGEIDEARVPVVAEALAPAIPIAPFAIEFSACGTFPPGGAPRVLWLGMSHGAAQLSDVHRVVSER